MQGRTFYWLPRWHLLLSLHINTADWPHGSQLGTAGKRCETGRETWSQNCWRKAEMELIPNLSIETWVLLATSLVLIYMWVTFWASPYLQLELGWYPGPLFLSLLEHPKRTWKRSWNQHLGSAFATDIIADPLSSRLYGSLPHTEGFDKTCSWKDVADSQSAPRLINIKSENSYTIGHHNPSEF